MVRMNFLWFFSCFLGREPARRVVLDYAGNQSGRQKPPRGVVDDLT
jgi:hypothetical protein